MFAGVMLVTALLGAYALLVPSATHATEQAKSPIQMLNAATVLNASGTTVGAAVLPQCRESAIYIRWNASAAAGSVTLESASDTAYTGTWAPMAVIAFTTASKEDIIQVTGIHLNLRTRVSSAITSGTVSSWLVCN